MINGLVSKEFTKHSLWHGTADIVIHSLIQKLALHAAVVGRRSYAMDALEDTTSHAVIHHSLREP